MGRQFKRFWRQLTCDHDFRINVVRKVHDHQEYTSCCSKCGKPIQEQETVGDMDLA